MTTFILFVFTVTLLVYSNTTLLVTLVVYSYTTLISNVISVQ